MNDLNLNTCSALFFACFELVGTDWPETFIAILPVIISASREFRSGKIPDCNRCLNIFVFSSSDERGDRRGEGRTEQVFRIEAN